MFLNISLGALAEVLDEIREDVNDRFSGRERG